VLESITITDLDCIKAVRCTVAAAAAAAAAAAVPPPPTKAELKKRAANAKACKKKKQPIAGTVDSFPVTRLMARQVGEKPPLHFDRTNVSRTIKNKLEPAVDAIMDEILRDCVTSGCRRTSRGQRRLQIPATSASRTARPTLCGACTWSVKLTRASVPPARSTLMR
jgi:hypothetical protein